VDPETISKKELLQVAGISYGQLYRWKRKGLIPEDWFQRKSTFTGQETFFPREKVLARIEKIKSMQDEDASLDEIADAVSPNLGEISMTVAEIRERGLVSSEAAELFCDNVRDCEQPLVFGEVVSLAALDTLLKTGDVSLDEGRVVLDALQENYPAFEGKPADLLFVRRMGLSTAMLITSDAEVRFDRAARVIARVNLSESAEALRARIR
jgi:DNA-binding transcriptional MerR regulator